MKLYRLRQFLRGCIDLIYPLPAYDKRIAGLSFEHFKEKCPSTLTIKKNYIALIRYGHPYAKALIYSAKFSKNETAFAICAQLIAEKIEFVLAIMNTGDSKNETIVIPVPSSKKRFREKGFNQCFEIARCLAPLLPPDVAVRTDIVVKHRHTNRQAWSSKEKRLDNLSIVSRSSTKLWCKEKISSSLMTSSPPVQPWKPSSPAS